jgi:site-specific recombinase XerD
MPRPTLRPTNHEPLSADGALVASPSRTLARLDDRVNDFVAASLAPNTIRMYQLDWRHFTQWCDEHDVVSLPAAPETVARFITDLAGVYAISTIQGHITSISVAHRAKGKESPTKSDVVRRTMRGIRRTYGVAPARKAPLRTGDVRSLVGTLNLDSLLGVRDRAILVLGFAGAFRRSELVALDLDDVVENGDGLIVTIRRSKTDQEGEGTSIGLPYGSDPSTCPVRTLRAWLDAAAIDDGAIFRRVDRWGNVGGRLSGRAVATVVQRTAEAAGLDPARLGGHSLRAGLITSAVEAGAQEWRVMRHSRHKSVHVFRGYVRDLNLLDGSNPVAAVGL